MDKRNTLATRIRNAQKNGGLMFRPPIPPPPPDLRSPDEKRRDKEIQRIKKEKEAQELIQEGIDDMFTMSLDKQQWAHDWNVEEYENNRIEMYENEFPCDESYDGVAQWCICYKCRPDWHSQPGGSLYKMREQNKETWEQFRMEKEDSEREKIRLRLKEKAIRDRKIARRKAKEEAKLKEEEDKKRERREELKKQMEEQEMEYRKFLIKSKDDERDQLIKKQGWKQRKSKTGKFYWVNKTESQWNIDVDYNPWLEFYSYKHDKQFWYNHKTKESVWINPNL